MAMAETSKSEATGAEGSVYAAKDYKSFLKFSVKSGAKTRRALTLRYLATQLDIQYTYLSKALNDPQVHLHEAHLLKSAEVLRLGANETEHLLILRNFQAAQYDHQRSYWQKKLNDSRRAQALSAKDFSTQDLAQTTQIRYLLDPMVLIIRLALACPEYRSQPRNLISRLQITESRLKEILHLLQECQVLRLSSEDPWKISEYNDEATHIGQDHPLMRTHQRLLKLAGMEQMFKTEEKKKESFVVTFSGEEATFEKLKEEFRAFLRKAEKLVGEARSKKVYHLSFDFFEWL